MVGWFSASHAANERGIFVTQIAWHPARPQTLFTLTTYSLGLLKSTDRGQTWTLANHGIRSYSLYQLAIDPRDPDVVYVGAGGGGLYKSRDGGATFVEKNDGLGNTDIGSMTLHPADPDKIYVVTSTGVFITPDGGESWLPWNQGDTFTSSQQFQDLLIVGSNPETVFLASRRGVFKRRPNDPVWSLASQDLAGRRISALALHPDGRRLFAAALRDGRTLKGGGLFVSTDHGARWKRLDRDVAKDWIRVLRFDQSNPRIVYAATSNRGVLKSFDGGVTWKLRNQGLTELDVRALVIDPARSSRLYAGTHGAGVFVSQDGGDRWVALDRVPVLDPETIIASLKVPDPSRPTPSITPPPAFAKCNTCHGWTAPDINQAPGFWLIAPNRRDWGPSVRRMRGPAKLTSDEEAQIVDFLTRYSLEASSRSGLMR